MPRQKQSPTKEEKIKQRLSHVLFVYRPAFHVIAAGRDRPAALNIKESRNKSSIHIHACLQKCISFYKKEFQFQSRQHRLLFFLVASNGTATPALPITRLRIRPTVACIGGFTGGDSGASCKKGRAIRSMGCGREVFSFFLFLFF